MAYSIIDPSQLKEIVNTICEKTKVIFATKSALRTEVATLNETISALEARVQALEEENNEPVNDQIESEEP